MLQQRPCRCCQAARLGLEARFERIAGRRGLTCALLCVGVGALRRSRTSADPSLAGPPPVKGVSEPSVPAQAPCMRCVHRASPARPAQRRTGSAPSIASVTPKRLQPSSERSRPETRRSCGLGRAPRGGGAGVCTGRNAAAVRRHDHSGAEIRDSCAPAAGVNCDWPEYSGQRCPEGCVRPVRWALSRWRGHRPRRPGRRGQLRGRRVGAPPCCRGPAVTHPANAVV